MKSKTILKSAGSRDLGSVVVRAWCRSRHQSHVLTQAGPGRDTGTGFPRSTARGELVDAASQDNLETTHVCCQRHR